ncbi:MAG: Fic family protein [Terriglobales bacterium]
MTPLQPWTQWITTEELHGLYAEGIHRFGGTGSPSKEGCVDGSLGAAFNAELYTMPEFESETAVSGLVFAGYLLFYLVQNHCFIDGNKRIGWLSCMYVLGKLGVTLEVSDDEADSYCRGIAAGAIRTGAEVVDWIAEHLKAID